MAWQAKRAMVAARIAKLPQGARTDIAPIEAMSQPAAADLLNVGRSAVQRAKTVQREGSPELVAAVDSGAISVSAAADVATLPLPHADVRERPTRRQAPFPLLARP